MAAKKTTTKKAPAKKPASKKNEKLDLTADDLPFKIVEPKLKIDENTGLIEQVFEDDKKVDPEKQLWGKNEHRTHALKDLWYDELQENLKNSKSPESAKREMAFMMTSNSILDFIMDSVPTEVALEVSYAIDHLLAMSLVNKKYNVDIIEEESKAMSIVKRKDYDSDDDYFRALEDIQQHWWTIGQPGLEMRSANDAVYEMLTKYRLNE